MAVLIPSSFLLWTLKFLLSCPSAGATSIITTIAGTGVSGSLGNGGPATSAQFQQPRSIWKNSVGLFYVADYDGHNVRKFSESDYIISNFAGLTSGATGGNSGDGGPATSANLNSPIAVQVDPTGRVIISDLASSVIRRVDTNGIISTVAGKNLLVVRSM